MNALLITILTVVSFTVYAQVPQKYLESAANNNPLLKSQFNLYQSELEKISQVKSLPDPQVNMGFFLMPMERFIGNQVASVSAMQMFPWFGTLGAAKSEAAYMAKARYEVFRETKSQVFFEVKQAYYELYFLEQEIKITKHNLEILKNIERIALARYMAGGNSEGGISEMKQQNNRVPVERKYNTSGMGNMSGMEQNQNAGKNQNMSRMNSSMGNMDSGSGSMVDVLRIQIEIKELESNLELLEDSKTPLTEKFLQLTGLPADEPIGIPDSFYLADPPVSLAEIPDSLKKNNPMILMLEAEEQSYMSMERMNKRMGMPMLGVGLQYDIFRPRESMGHNDVVSSMNGKNMLMPMVSFTVPIWRGKYKGSVKEAKALKEASRVQQIDTEQKLMVSFAELRKANNDALRRHKLYTGQLQLAQQSINILTTQYSAGGTTFEEVLRMQQQILNIQLNIESSIRDNHLAIAGMERLMGR
ncbi:MAG: TolC family protein [Cytophagaceae bacterium]